MKTTLQKLGKSLSAMVMPNIGAFIAWGFITALFIADGWLPNEQLASIQPYMLTYLLPVLIAATGGRMVGGDRGLGLCWKAGIAAEVIGIPAGSIGEKLYKAKVYLETPDLFAWTIVIIAVSVGFEKIFMFVFRRSMGE